MLVLPNVSLIPLLLCLASLFPMCVSVCFQASPWTFLSAIVHRTADIFSKAPLSMSAFGIQLLSINFNRKATMDPADTHHALSILGALVGHHEQLICSLVDNIANMAKTQTVQQPLLLICSASLPTISTVSMASTPQCAIDSHVFDPEPFQP